MKKIYSLITILFCAILSLPINAGEISFAPYVIIPTGSFPEVVAIGDVNNDSRNDVVMGTSSYFDSLYDYKVFVFLQTVDGFLDTPVIYQGGDITSIDIDDLNDDGRQDVAIGFSDSIGIFYQNTSGTLQPMMTSYSGSAVNGLKIGDFNGDSLHDIATCHGGSPYIRIHYQQPAGVFDTHSDQPISISGFNEIDAMDVSNDGLDDIIVLLGTVSADSTIAVFNQDSLHQFLAPFYLSMGPLWHRGLAVGDVNDDGRNDIVASSGGNLPNAHIGVWLQNDATVQNPPALYDSYECPEPVEICDFDLDGRNDFVVGNGGWNAISTYHQNTTGSFEQYDTSFMPYASHYQPQGVAAGDFNNDGRPDLAFASFDDGLVILYNTSTTGVSGEQSGQIGHKETLELKIAGNKISYKLPQSGRASLKVYNLLGQEVNTLFRENKTAGEYKITWDGRDDSNRRVSSGVYLIRLEANGQAAAAKILVVR